MCEKGCNCEKCSLQKEVKKIIQGIPTPKELEEWLKQEEDGGA